MNIDSYSIMLFVVILSLLIGVVLLIVAGTYKHDDVKKQEDIKMYLYIAGSVLSSIGVIGASYLIYITRPTTIAKSILSETDPIKYMDQCNELVNTKDAGIIEQFKDMKVKRPIEEVRNLCGNMAKNTLEIA